MNDNNEQQHNHRTSGCTLCCRRMWVIAAVVAVTIASYYFVEHNHVIRTVDVGESDITCMNRQYLSGVFDGVINDVAWRISFISTVYASELNSYLLRNFNANYVVYHHSNVTGSGFYETYLAARLTENLKILITWKQNDPIAANCTNNLTTHYYFNPIDEYNYRTVNCYSIYSTRDEFVRKNFCECYKFDPLFNTTNAFFDKVQAQILLKLLDESFPYVCIEKTPFSNPTTWFVVVVFFTSTLFSIVRLMSYFIKLDWSKIHMILFHRYQNVRHLLGIQSQEERAPLAAVMTHR